MWLRLYLWGYWQVWPVVGVSRLDTFREYHLYLVPFLKITLHLDR